MLATSSIAESWRITGHFLIEEVETELACMRTHSRIHPSRIVIKRFMIRPYKLLLLYTLL